MCNLARSGQAGFDFRSEIQKMCSNGATFLGSSCLRSRSSWRRLSPARDCGIRARLQGRFSSSERRLSLLRLYWTQLLQLPDIATTSAVFLNLVWVLLTGEPLLVALSFERMMALKLDDLNAEDEVQLDTKGVDSSARNPFRPLKPASVSSFLKHCRDQ